MKKILFTALAFALAAMPAFAANITKNYPLKGFTGLRASSVYHVELSQSSGFSVKVEAPDYLEPYLKVEISGDNLVLGLESLPRSVSRKLSNEKEDVLRAEVRMPVLESVSLSGAAKLECRSTFPELRGKSFKLDQSGASRANGLSVSGASADIRMSGASHAELAGSFGKVRLGASGAAKAKLAVEATSVDAELSGSASVDFDGSFENMGVEASGASKAASRSAAQLSTLRVEGSGAAAIDLRDAKAQDVRVELSGAASCKVSALRSIEIEASGASTCLYESAADTKVNVIQVSRGASVRRL